MRVDVTGTSALTFDDGSPVRAASAVAPLGDGWLVVQDDATHAAWWRPDSFTALRVVPPVDGWEHFTSAAGTKHLKPDFEAACAVPVGDTMGVLLLGSGSTAARTRASLVTVPPAGVDVDAAALLAAVTRTGPADRVEVGEVRVYDLGTVDGVALAVTDAVALPGGRVLVSAAAEDTPNAVDDGQVVAAALALLDDDGVLAVAEVPRPAPACDPYKVEGLAVRRTTDDGLRLLAVVDADDPTTASQRLEVRLSW